jgi:hypothetical protein
LLLLLVNISGFYGYFIVRLNQLHEESREALKYLPDSELDHFVLSPQEFKKARVNEREVLINGKMYDIARVHTGSEMIEVFALHDEAEDDLLAFICRKRRQGTISFFSVFFTDFFEVRFQMGLIFCCDKCNS